MRRGGAGMSRRAGTQTAATASHAMTDAPAHAMTGAQATGAQTGTHHSRRATDAAQFMPFAALTGYYGLVQARERELDVEPRRPMTEERQEELSNMLVRLRRGDGVVVTHYDRRSYVTTRGTVRQVNEVRHTLDLVEGGSILFVDIWEIAWA